MCNERKRYGKLTVDGDDNYRKKIKTLYEYEGVELSEIALSNAVVNPWTMVIVAVDTGVTKVAMSAPRRSNNLTVRAQATCLHSFEKFDEV